MLHGTGGKRGSCVTPFIAPFDIRHTPLRIGQVGHNLIGMRRIRNIKFVELASGDFDEAGTKRRRFGRLLQHIGFDAPVFLGYKRIDFSFAFDHQAYRHRLYSPRRQATAHPFPQYTRQTIPHQAIENTSCLLRIYQRHVNVTRLCDGLFDRIRGDFGKRDTMNRCFFGNVNSLHNMPRNGFALAIRVSGHVDGTRTTR